MTGDESPSTAARAAWMGVLARADKRQLADAMNNLKDPPPFEWLRRPEIGAVMTQGRAGGTGQAFSLGEMTVTRCALRLKAAPDVIGHAYVQGRDAVKAENAALADAMLQTQDYAQRVQQTVIEPLQAAEAERRLAARRKAGATKVDFFTMVRAEA